MPLIPIALATGWSAGVLFLLGLLPGPFEVEPNPMSITLGALVVAISTEFSVLLSARYRQEREAGAGPARAIELTYASTGAAVLASGATAIAGFAALVASDIRMLRDFGIVTVVDLTVSLLGVMLVLPAALVWAEQHGAVQAARPGPAAPAAGAAPAAPLACLTSRPTSRPSPADDPFADLGAEEAGRRRREAIGDKLAERDRVAPEPEDRGPEVPRPGNKYAWVVGIVMLMGIAVLLLTTRCPTAARGSAGPQPGELLRPFAAPLGHGERRRRRRRQRLPGASRARRPPARCPPASCAAELVLNVCELRERPLVLTFIVTAAPTASRRSTASSGCATSSRSVQVRRGHQRQRPRARPRRSSSGAAGGSRWGWTATARCVNLYGIGVCPVTVFAPPGRHRGETELGNLTEDELRRQDRRGSECAVAELDLRDGWVAPELAEEFPELGLVYARARGAPGAHAARGQGAPADARQPLHRRQGGPHAPGGGAVGLPGLLPPGRDRPGQPPHAGRAGRARPDEVGRLPLHQPAWTTRS